LHFLLNLRAFPKRQSLNPDEQVKKPVASHWAPESNGEFRANRQEATRSGGTKCFTSSNYLSDIGHAGLNGGADLINLEAKPV
jgi:hypothetical protein